MQRRKFIAFTAATIVSTSSLLGGCVTRSLYEKIDNNEYVYYNETVSRILITQDDKSIVIIGARHHYIVEAPESLVQAIRSGFHARLRASFGPFSVDREANLSGVLILTLGAESTRQECEEADSIGFEVPEKPDADIQRRKGYHLKGKRYLASNFQLPSQAKSLNQSYEIRVIEIKPIGGKAALALLTPVTVAADGAMLLLAIPLVPILTVYWMRYPPRIM